MSKRTLGIVASFLILAALALLVLGLANEQPFLWGPGLVVVGIAMAISFATRWAGGGPE